MHNQSSMDNVTNMSIFIEATYENTTNEEEYLLYPIEWVIPITVVYGIIFVSGIIGNVSTCIVIARNKSLHTVTNYYLFSIAISDLLLLISGLPPEMYRIWSPETYVFGEVFCVLQGFAAETSANATVLAITAFTVERYLAICHPFLSHTMSNLSRAIKYIIAIWIVALCLAAPQAIQFGIRYEYKNGIECSSCTVVTTDFFEHAFEISTFLIFLGPLTLITVLYILIAIKLRKSRVLTRAKRPSLGSDANNDGGVTRASKTAAAQNRVIKMLVAVVVAFFLCWAPFHAQRLLAVYLSTASQEAQAMCFGIYIALMYISGVLYFLSTTVNPVLYHIMSNKFREAFKNTFYEFCGRKKKQDIQNRAYSVLSRYPPSLRNYRRSVSDGVQTTQQAPLTSQTDCSDVPKFTATRKKPLRNNFRRPMISQTSQTTVLSTISKTISTNGKGALEKRPIRKITPDNLDTVERGVDVTYSSGLRRLLRYFYREKREEASTCLRNSSMESGNTISNSSLQDLEEIEFSSTDLVRYMEEVNEDLT